MTISLIATAHASSAYGSAVSITHGATLQAGDVAIAFLEIDAGKTFADNNGVKPFTQAYTATVEAEDARSDIWYRVCDGGEASAFAFTASGNDDWSATVRVFRGVDASVWDAPPSSANDGQGNSSTATAPTITILTAGACALLMVGLDASDNSVSNVTNSFTGLIRYGQTTSRNHATAYRLGCSTGALGDTSVTLGAVDGWLAVQCALKPAVTVQEESGGSIAAVLAIAAGAGDAWEAIVAVQCRLSVAPVRGLASAVPTRSLSSTAPVRGLT